MDTIKFKFTRDEQAEREEYKRTQEYRNQGPSMRSLDLTNFLPGVSDQLWPCPCGKFLTMGGNPCRECRGGKA